MKQTKTRRCIVLGFGGVAKSSIPIIINNKIPISEFVVIDRLKISEKDLKLFFGNEKVNVINDEFPYEEIYNKMEKIFRDDDIVLDFFGCSESLEIIKACNTKQNIIYLNCSLEEYIDRCYPTQFALYKTMYDYRKENKFNGTAVIDAGANPGMVTHFAILGILHMARDAVKNKVKDYEKIEELLNKKDLPGLAEIMEIDTIHISEIEDMIMNEPEKFIKGYTVNSWCIESFHEEWNIESEVSIGTKDRESLTKTGYNKIPDSVPEFTTVPYPTYLFTASPKGKFTGRSVRHPETMEISYIFSNENHVPTVSFVYHPSEISLISMEQNNWEKLPTKLFCELNASPLRGSETMGATLITARKDIKSRWYGSVVSCEESRRVGCLLNPTTLQVAAGVISHLIVALNSPNKGICMPHDFDSDEIMKYAAPYLGDIIDKDLDFELSPKWEDLLSNKENMKIKF